MVLVISLVFRSVKSLLRSYCFLGWCSPPPTLGTKLGRINGDLSCRLGYGAFIPNDIDDLALFVAQHIDAVFLTVKKSIASIVELCSLNILELDDQDNHHSSCNNDLC